ncbi:MAG: potassium transporter Kup [Myxococcales bacterium]|nr:MAG: potassium transporter Kup [Myxococcales bacterium]
MTASSEAAKAASSSSGARSDLGISRQQAHGTPDHGPLAPLVLTALGVVFGDIGTSPLYALKECFAGHHGAPVTPDNILGVLSLMFWSLFGVVAFKYVTFIMRADNEGEGGILALLALLPEKNKQSPRGGAGGPLVLLALFGAALLYGDGTITPAMSVLSAVEGINVATPTLKDYVVPVTLVILCGLFAVQRKGTEGIGGAFGPVMVVWFSVLAILGVVQLVQNPSVLWALSPWYGVKFLLHNGSTSIHVLGAVVLCVTGGEALYADMGHFGRPAIRIAWYAMVLPCLMLNYLGQGALLLRNPEAAQSSPLFEMAPRWGLYPLVGLATAAAVIASQALISGAFSLTRQAVQLGFSPRVTVVHTSERHEGQIYIPEVNSILWVVCMLLVVFFGSSTRMAAAYGLAECGLMAITSVIFFVVATSTWGWPVWKALPLVAIFLVYDLGFLAANLVKIRDGGWVPLLMGVVIFTAMTTWKTGRQMLAKFFAANNLPLASVLEQIEAKPPPRVTGTAVFMTQNPTGVPVVLRHHYRHNQVLHEQVVLLSVLSENVPYVSPRKRIIVEELPHGFFRVTARFGFMETPRIPAILEAVAIFGLAVDPETVTFYLGRETLIATEHAGMSRWRKALFSFMSRNARPATAYFGIPADRVIELGMQVEL